MTNFRYISDVLAIQDVAGGIQGNRLKRNNLKTKTNITNGSGSRYVN